MTTLNLARNFSLPVDAVTTAIGIIGLRGSGKTHTASVVAEEMLAAGMQVVVLDPLDAWYGLRTSADGKGAGFPITVLGGEHADIPLEAASGAIVAEFAVEHGASLVLSLRHFSKTDQRRFVADFCEKLYRLKGHSDNRSPVHIIIDEADEVAPQKLSHGSERCFGAVDTLVRRGRSSGIGVTLITQRPAAINKDVLTQIELLIAHRVISPQDRKAIEAWIEAHPVGETAKEAAKSLASLAKGECWVWSPSWLDVFKRTTIRQRRTFDSSATPKAGEGKIVPSGRAVVELDALRSAMVETIQKAEENDPAKLRKRIAELERQFDEALQTEPVEDHMACLANELSLNGALEESHILIRKLQTKVDEVRTIIDFPVDAIPVPDRRRLVNIRPTTILRSCTSSPPIPVRPTRRSDIPSSNGSLGKCPAALLAVICAYPNGRSAPAVALQSGYSITSSSFSNGLSELRSRGYIDGNRNGLIATDAGVQANGSAEPMLRGRALVEWWARRLGKCERSLLLSIADSRRPLGREELSVKSGYSETSSSFSNALSKLRTLGLIGRGNEFTLSDEVHQ